MEKDEIFKLLGEKVYEVYTESEFGKVLKSELDLIVFHAFLQDKISEEYKKDDRIQYYLIDKKEIRRLSFKSGMNETRVKNFLEKDFLLNNKQNEDKSYEDLLLQIVNSTDFKNELLQSGKIKVSVPNPIAQSYLEEKITSLGGTLIIDKDSSTIEFALYDFLLMVNAFTKEDITEKIVKNIKADKKIKDKTILAEISNINEKSLKERFDDFKEKYGKETREIILNVLTDLIKAKLKSGEK